VPFQGLTPGSVPKPPLLVWIIMTRLKLPFTPASGAAEAAVRCAGAPPTMAADPATAASAPTPAALLNLWCTRTSFLDRAKWKAHIPDPPHAQQVDLLAGIAAAGARAWHRVQTDAPTMSHLKNPRALFAACVIVVAALVGVIVLPRIGPGSTAEPRPVVRSGLTLEAFPRPDTGARELLVSLTTPPLNRLDVTDGARLVVLRCFDASGAQVIRRPVDWPLLEEVGYPPHTHQPATARLLASIRACRLTGPGVAFDGRVSGRLPVSR